MNKMTSFDRMVLLVGLVFVAACVSPVSSGTKVRTFGPGVHYLTETAVLTGADSGTVWKAAPGAKPVISGARKVTGWRKAVGGLWVADVPWVTGRENGFRQLTVDGELRPRAKHPNKDYFYSLDFPRPAGVTWFQWEYDFAKMRFRIKPGEAFANGSSEVSERGLYRTDSGTNVYEYLLFAPPDFYEDWCWYVRQRKVAHPGIRFAVKNTAAVYAEHPFGTGLACRNAAESLHAYVRAAWTNGVLEYVVLGGAWLDAQDIYGAQPRFATGEALSLSNSVPGVYGYPREDWRAIPADYFYACPGLAAGEKYPWDANGNGKYIDQGDCSKNDLVPRLCVSRITLNPYNGGRDPYNQHELITNYVAKLKRGEAKSFAGHYRYGMSAASTGSSKQRKTGDRMYYRELEFYDGMLNMFDPRHHDTLEDDEYSVRVRTYDQYSMWRPVREVKGMMSYTWTGGLPSLSAAMDDYYAAARRL